jgi:hypothetical protein
MEAFETVSFKTTSVLFVFVDVSLQLHKNPKIIKAIEQ